MPFRSKKPNHVWYIAYGSNIKPDGISAYLTRRRNRRRYLERVHRKHPVPIYRDIMIPHKLYFAGESKTWQGPVAFVSPAFEEKLPSLARAYLLTPRQLKRIIKRENGDRRAARAVKDLTKLPFGSTDLNIPADPEGYRGKYNALLRLDDLDQIPAYTLTTARSLKIGDPSAAYEQQLITGLQERTETPVAYLRARYLSQ